MNGNGRKKKTQVRRKKKKVEAITEERRLTCRHTQEIDRQTDSYTKVTLKHLDSPVNDLNSDWKVST